MTDIKDYAQTQDLVRICAERDAEIKRLRAVLTHISVFCIGKGQRLAQDALEANYDKSKAD